MCVGGSWHSRSCLVTKPNFLSYFGRNCSAGFLHCKTEQFLFESKVSHLLQYSPLLCFVMQNSHGPPLLLSLLCIGLAGKCLSSWDCLSVLRLNIGQFSSIKQVVVMSKISGWMSVVVSLSGENPFLQTTALALNPVSTRYLCRAVRQTSARLPVAARCFSDVSCRCPVTLSFDFRVFM